jgi:hypothetical protein
LRPLARSAFNGCFSQKRRRAALHPRVCFGGQHKLGHTARGCSSRQGASLCGCPAKAQHARARTCACSASARPSEAAGAAAPSAAAAAAVSASAACTA